MNNNTLAVREALHQSVGSAEKQLTVIGNNHGDDQLAIIVSELSVPEIIVMIGEYDMTSPSLVSAFITPEQFLAIVDQRVDEIVGAYGSMSPLDLSHALVDIHDKVENVLCPIIYASSASDREGEMLDALLAHDHGYRLILLAGLGRKGFADALKNPLERLSTRGTWQSLLIAFHQHQPKNFAEFKDFYFNEWFADSVTYDSRGAHAIIQELLPEDQVAGEAEPVEFLSF